MCGPRRPRSKMCGRYKLSAVHKDVQKHFDLIDAGFEIQPSDEIFPGTDILAVDRNRRPEMIHWTIEDCDNSGITRKVINAKSETVSFVNMFRDAFRNGRVLIPATGFYEWKDAGGKKEKYEFEFDEPLFAFAGIARECEIKGEKRRCGVILTTEANDVVRPIHAKNRMPVILHKYDYDRWLDPGASFAELKRMTAPVRNEEITARPVKEQKKGG
jgi:putative SOS response-associated peptidase YedK